MKELKPFVPSELIPASDWVWVACTGCGWKFYRRAEFEQGDPAKCLECQGTAIGYPFSIFIRQHGAQR